jgi:hypothetical protein
MRPLFWLALAAGCSSNSPPPPADDSGRVLEAWARDLYTLSAPSPCAALEQSMFGARSATCWRAKARVERSPTGSRLYPRFEIVVADHGSDDGAARRLARFHDVPSAHDASTKAYPLRAGFRVGQRVVIVTTDAFAFADEVDRVAADLSERMAGHDLTCWRTCAD